VSSDPTSYWPPVVTVRRRIWSIWKRPMSRGHKIDAYVAAGKQKHGAHGRVRGEHYPNPDTGGAHAVRTADTGGMNGVRCAQNHGGAGFRTYPTSARISAAFVAMVGGGSRGMGPGVGPGVPDPQHFKIAPADFVSRIPAQNPKKSRDPGCQTLIQCSPNPTPILAKPLLPSTRRFRCTYRQ
jgi:hypothetical protein